MNDAKLALLQHLEAARAAFGSDLPIAVPMNDPAMLLASTKARQAMAVTTNAAVVLTAVVPTAGPLAAGPLAAGSLAAGPLAAGSRAAGPLAAGPLAAGSRAAGPLAAGPLAAGPFAAGSLAAGSLAAGPLAAGPSQAVVEAAAPAEAAAKEPRSDTKAIPPALDPSRAIATAITQPATKPGTQLVAAAELPPPLPNGHERSQADPLVALRAETFACRLCALCESRRIVVFGEGNRAPEVLFLGEAPGAVEDQTGQPLVGPAGQLFDKILQGAMGLDRADIYLANINKCRPPGNRTPTVEEVAACMPFLTRQVSILRPKVIVALGRGAAQSLLGTNAAMRDLRGCELNFAGIPVVVTWHPAFLLQDPSRKRETWEDIKRVNRLLGRPEVPPERPTES